MTIPLHPEAFSLPYYKYACEQYSPALLVPSFLESDCSLPIFIYAQPPSAPIVRSAAHPAGQSDKKHLVPSSSNL
jgi:hypothetical protein